MVSKIFSQFLMILAARNSVTIPKPGETPWPFLDDQLMIRNLMLISEHLPNLPNLPLFVCWSNCWSNPHVGQCSEWHRRRLCRFSSASARSCSCRTYSPGGIAGREDVVFCDLLSKKTYKISYNIIYQQMSKIYFTIDIDKQAKNQVQYEVIYHRFTDRRTGS